MATTARGRKAAPTRKPTTRKAATGAKRSPRSGFWFEFWTLLGKLTGAVRETRKAYRSGTRAVRPISRTSRTSRGPAQRPAGSAPSRGRAGGGFQPVDPRSVEEVWASRPGQGPATGDPSQADGLDGQNETDGAGDIGSGGIDPSSAAGGAV